FQGKLFLKSVPMPRCPVLNTSEQLLCLLLPWGSPVGLRGPYWYHTSIILEKLRHNREVVSVVFS
ncbi:unnamed protein product, partial [Bubo scandiacus]